MRIPLSGLVVAWFLCLPNVSRAYTRASLPGSGQQLGIGTDRRKVLAFLKSAEDEDNDAAGVYVDLDRTVQETPLATELVGDTIPSLQNEESNTSEAALGTPDPVTTTIEPLEGTDERSMEDSVVPLERKLLHLQSFGAVYLRGEFAPKLEKEWALHTIAEIEASNPTPRPTLSPLILGRWELVYASTQLFRSSPFFMAGRAVCTTQDQADQYNWFCDMHRQALAVSNIGPVRQIVSETRLTSEFEVKVGSIPFLSDVTPFRYSGGMPVTVNGAIVSSADLTPLNDGTGWELFLDTVEIKGSNVPILRQVLDGGLKLPSRLLGDFLETNVPVYRNPKPIFRTTYLDETYRISRDQDNNAFVYVKASSDESPTDYSYIDSDLGIGRLLEGFNDAITKIYL